ncbi:Cytidylyltransferase (HIGH family) exon-1 [Cryptosporidium felis]|nr:Cytidylyltransferase (HIGH family) exon-1 [Cryptosporidium felis]
MPEIEHGFLILNPLWWNDINTSYEARNSLFELLYSCIFHTSRSLFVYYSVLPLEKNGQKTTKQVYCKSLDETKNIYESSFVELTYKHINSIVKAYEIALEIIEIQRKIPTFDIRFIPVKDDCLDHIYRTIRLRSEAFNRCNLYDFCEKHGSLIHCADIISNIFSCVSQENIYYIKLNSSNRHINLIVCDNYISQLILSGYHCFEVSDNLIIPNWNDRLENIIESDDSSFFESPVNRTLFAGTFDRLHPGHKVNITVATWYAKEMVIIGLTDKSLNTNKSDGDIIQDFSFRSSAVHSFVFSLCPDISVAILRISSVVGGADIFEFDALIATPESFKNAAKINDLRLASGSSIVKLVKVPFVYRPRTNILSTGKETNGRTPVKFCSTELRRHLKQNLEGPSIISLLRNAMMHILNDEFIPDCKNLATSFLNLICSFVDDLIFEIMHRWKTTIGIENGKRVFEDWLRDFATELELDVDSSNKGKNVNEHIEIVSRYITSILIYLMSTYIMIKKNTLKVPLNEINRMYLLFCVVLNMNVTQACEHQEFCIPYICCSNEIESHFFFGKNKFEYSKFKYQYKDLLTKRTLDLEIGNEGYTDDESSIKRRYLEFGFVKKGIDECFK